MITSAQKQRLDALFADVVLIQHGADRKGVDEFGKRPDLDDELVAR